MSKRPDKQPVGAQLGSQNGLSHGIVAFKNEIERSTRRGRSLIDRRGAAGRNAFAMREQLILDMGGAGSPWVAKLALIEMIARDNFTSTNATAEYSG